MLKDILLLSFCSQCINCLSITQKAPSSKMLLRKRSDNWRQDLGGGRFLFTSGATSQCIGKCWEDQRLLPPCSSLYDTVMPLSLFNQTLLSWGPMSYGSGPLVTLLHFYCHPAKWNWSFILDYSTGVSCYKDLIYKDKNAYRRTNRYLYAFCLSLKWEKIEPLALN